MGILNDVLPSIITKSNRRIKQDEASATYAYTIKREDEHLDFHKSALEVFNKVRALNPEPYAYIILNDEEMKIIDGYIGCESNAFIGSICDIKKDAIGIKCLDKVFYVTEVKPFGKKKMKVHDYLNGVNKEKLKDSIVK